LALTLSFDSVFLIMVRISYLSMKRVSHIPHLLFAALFVLGLGGALHAQPDTWVTSFGSGLQDAPEDILVDDAGNSYVSGYFRDTMRIQNVEMISAGKNDVFLAKFDPSGQLTWAKRFGWFSNEFAHGLAFDKLGNVLMVGEYQDSTIFDTDTIYSGDTLWYGPPALTYDVFWVRVTPAGVMDTVWADGWFGSENFYEVSVGEDSLYYFAGMYRTFNYWTFGSIFDSRSWGKGYDDAIWVRSNSHGYMDHKAIAAGKYVDRATTIDLIGDSLVVMAGTFQDTCYFRDSTIYGVGGFNDDIWVACYGDTGTYRWTVQGASKAVDKISALVTAADGSIYVAGLFDSVLTFAGTQLVGSGNLDGFVAKLDLNGNLQWLKKFGGLGFDVVQDLRMMASGEILVTGYFQREMQLDGGLSLSLADSNDQNAFIAVINAAGNTRWVKSLGGTSPDVGVAVDEDAAGYIYAVGTYAGAGQFGQVTVHSTGAEDIYLLRMNSDGAVFAPNAHETTLGSVNAWPNPTQDRLNISFELAQASEVAIVWTDLSGKVVATQALGRRVPGLVSTVQDLSDLPSGLYLYRIQAAGGSFTGKVAVQH
jgi:Secretion system C-terminal sorting domain